MCEARRGQINPIVVLVLMPQVDKGLKLRICSLKEIVGDGYHDQIVALNANVAVVGQRVENLKPNVCGEAKFYLIVPNAPKPLRQRRSRRMKFAVDNCNVCLWRQMTIKIYLRLHFEFQRRVGVARNNTVDENDESNVRPFIFGRKRVAVSVDCDYGAVAVVALLHRNVDDGHHCGRCEGDH